MIQATRENPKLLIVKNSKLTAPEFEEIVRRWQSEGKPSKIAASFTDISELQDMHINHFKGNPYVWKPIQGSIFAGMCMDDTIDYIHLVMATEPVLEYILSLKYE